MATNPSFTKRQKEQARQAKQREKDVKRKERREGKEKPSGTEGEDPDIAGIIPGPQPQAEEEAEVE